MDDAGGGPAGAQCPRQREDIVNIRSKAVWSSVAVAGIVAAGAAAYAQAGRPMSPTGSAVAHVQGKWTNPGKETYALGGGS